MTKNLIPIVKDMISMCKHITDDEVEQAILLEKLRKIDIETMGYKPEEKVIRMLRSILW